MIEIPVKFVSYHTGVAVDYRGYVVQFVYDTRKDCVIAIVRSGEYFYDLRLDRIKYIEDCTKIFLPEYK